MKYLTHVGEIIEDELFARNKTQLWLKQKTNISPVIINFIIKGKRGINPKYALKLEKAFGIDAEFWLTAQMNYELGKLRNAIKRRNKIKNEISNTKRSNK